MIGALAGILLCQLIGETVVRAFALPLPGPVFGMGLLFCALLFRGGQGTQKIPAPLAGVADGLLGHLSLLFVPAAVGPMNYFDLLAANAATLTLAVVVSTTLTMAATAATFRLLSSSGERK
ncbi:MAG: CidA/LrgA family protein [Rhodoblastus sp.]|uniref:CidA/LrgA family protein n=1 Tax=Rhodoblastus sp. TaxID=1962975 RepID=UPI003F96A1AA